MEPIVDTAEVTKNLRLARSWVILLMGHSAEMTPDGYIAMCIDQCPTQPLFFLQKMGTNLDTAGQCAESERLGALTPKWVSSLKPLLPSGMYQKRRQEGCRATGGEGLQDTTGMMESTNSQSVAVCTRPVHS